MRDEMLESFAEAREVVLEVSHPGDMLKVVIDLLGGEAIALLNCADYANLHTQVAHLH